VTRDLDRDNVALFAAGLAFFALLSGTPLLVAIVSIYGLASDPLAVERQVNALGELLPEAVRPLIADQLREIVRTSPRGLGLGAAASIAAAMWAGSKGVFHLFRALNIAYAEQETRGYLRMKVVAYLFTVGFIGLAVVAIALVGVLPAVLDVVGLGAAQERLFALGRWPVLAGALLVGLAFLYRFGPDRKQARWRWVSPGSLVVTLAWISLSFAFSTTVATFGKFNETYGSLGAAIALLVWFYVTALLVLFGAALNARWDPPVGG
jgi:membrane protein